MRDRDIVEKMAVLYLIHFGNKDPEKVTCKDCEDFKMGLCRGGCYDIVECMYDKAVNGELLVGGL